MRNTDSAIKFFTRGGQTFLHNYRMIMQILSRVGLFILCTFLICTAAFFFMKTTKYQRYIGTQWVNAELSVWINERATVEFVNPNGKKVTTFASEILKSDMVNTIVATLWVTLVKSLLMSVFFNILLLILITRWLKARGHEQTQDQFIKGDQLVDSKTLVQLIKRSNKNSAFHLGNIPLPKEVERAHMLLHGTTGAGKSETIRQLLDTIRSLGDRAIIYDKSCDFVRHYYRHDKDVILNPLDERGAAWHLWDECRNAPDYDSLASALMPMPIGTTDPFWINAARTIFSAAAYEMRKDKDRSTIKLLTTLLTAELDAMSKLLKGTEAETLTSDKTEKTAISIKSVLATYLKSLKYIKDEQPAFSIRQWIQDDKQSHWLFISSLADQHETLKPLISTWLDIAANALMSLEPSNTRRIWLILDELTSLHKLPYLNSAFAEARKFGGCLVIGIQSIAQLRQTYGQQGAEEISGLCNTRVFFRTPTSDTARWVSNELGLAEIAEVREGYSYGEDSIRAGVSLTHQHIQRPLVNYSEVMALKNLHAYLRLPGDWPVTQLHIEYKERLQRNAPFVQRAIDPKPIAEVTQLIEHYEKVTREEPPKPTLPTTPAPKTTDTETASTRVQTTAQADLEISPF